MASNDWLRALREALSSLSAAVQAHQPDAEDIPVPYDALPADTVERREGLDLLALSRPAVLLSCPADEPGGENLLRLAAHLAESLVSGSRLPDTVWSVYRRILEGELQGPELEAAAADHHLKAGLPRCVLLLRAASPGQRAWETLRDIIPTQNSDALVELSRSDLALVKDLTDGETPEDVRQYALALQETVSAEMGLPLTVGVSEPADSLGALAECMRQARRAAEIGEIYRPGDSLYVYDRLVLERLLTHIPAEVSERCQRLLFNRRTAKLFDEEMLDTIETFFRKDLNLSDTARQLYIHRNTLVYRLDKVQRLTGLDLRSFDDSVTFKVLMELRRYAAAAEHKNKKQG